MSLYGTGQWHSNYKRECRNKTNDELIYIRLDCREAIRANPDSPKLQQYMDEINYCSEELFKREN